MTPRSFLVAAVLGGTLLAGGAAADEAARVDATLRYEGKVMKLDRVLILRHGDEEGLEDGPRLRIYLTDGDLPLTVAGGASTLKAKAYARQAKINGVVITADPAGKNPAGVASLLNAPGLVPGGFGSSSNSNAFSQLQVSASRASGTASFGGGQLEVQARFDAPVAANPVTADLNGQAAIDSPPAKAFLAYSDALKKIDMATVGKYATASRVQQITDFRSQAGDNAFREALKTLPSGAALAKSIKRVIVRGTAASVVLDSKEVNELTQGPDGWKMD